MTANSHHPRRHPIPTSFGYVTIPFQTPFGHPVTGRHLRITLTGPPIDQRQSTGTAEITGKYDGAGVTPVTHNNKSILNLIETDIYQSTSPKY